MDERGRELLEGYLRFQRELGIERVRISPAAVARLQPRHPADGHPSPPTVPSTLTSGSNLNSADPTPARPLPTPSPELQLIRAEIGECTRCPLATLGRQTIVFGEGNPLARVVFVGEGPGADEDVSGRPFVGRAGQLLTDMIEKGMGLAREDAYICNVVKCRPPGNRTPTPEECATCSPFLRRQLTTIGPELIVALGSTAAQNLLGYKGPLGPMRGRVHSVTVEGRTFRLVVTYHPAYLLRDPSQKKAAWQDLQLAMVELGLKPPAPARK